MRALQAGMMQRLSESVLPAFPSRVLCSVITSLCSYSGSSTAHQVLDQLFPRSHLPSIPGDALIPFGTHGGSLAHCVRDAGGQDHLPNAIYFLLGTWLGQGQDCREPLRFPAWTLQLATLHISFGGSHVEGHAYLLPGHLEHLKAIEAERKEPAPKLLPLPEPEPVPAPGLEPAAPPVSPRVVELEPAAPESATPGPEQGPPLEAAPEPNCLWAVTTEDQLREEKLNILDFPPQLVAEQLTRMAAELFKTLVPAHCLGSIWSERDNREREYLAPTVRDSVMHDNTVANCILVTCLGDPSMTAQDRARVVELWIRVAEECRGLGNFCSLHTILSALQSPAIARLQDTWGQVSRESSRTWKKWVRREKRVSRELLVQEATSVLKTAERAHQGAQERQRQQGVVPSLVTFFHSLELLDATMEDYVEGNVLNCRKWNEQFKLMDEIELLQEAANLYTVQPDEHFGAWFQAVEPLSKEERPVPVMPRPWRAHCSGSVEGIGLSLTTSAGLQQIRGHCYRNNFSSVSRGRNPSGALQKPPGSRQSQRPWMPEMDLSLFFCLCPGLYLLPHLDLQGKPGKPTQTSVFWFLQAEYGKYCSYFG
ncbi:ral guanine nucleotide dissociation stimulator-like isoform X1 [Equus caballus]|uniref:ral guanine nucleotide dissociation stimulator-like isoform X1 n=1 Tax=Equus caballus TaxID=9796 RepID=UPI0038B2B20D